MQLEIQIQTENLYLRTLQPEDATLIYLGWLSDPAINAYLEVRFAPPKSVHDLASMIVHSKLSSHTLMLGIFLQDESRHIGNIKLGPIDWNHQVADMGFLIGDIEQWGKGYASQSIALLADYGFSHLGLAKITAGCYAENEGSCRALLKAGFVLEGRRLSQWAVSAHRQDGLLFGQVNPDVVDVQKSPVISGSHKFSE